MPGSDKQDKGFASPTQLSEEYAEKLAWLRKAFQEGLDSGASQPADNMLNRLTAKYAVEFPTDVKRRVVKLEDFTEKEMALIAATEAAGDPALDAELSGWQP